MEIGEYCKLSSCSTLTFLPVNCPYCRIRYCQSHFLPAQHDCKAPGAAEADRTLSDAEILKRIQRANERRREVQQGAAHSTAAGTLPPDDVNNTAGPSKLPCQKAGCKQYSLQLDPSTPQGMIQSDDGGGGKVNVIHKAPRCERCRGFFCMSHRSVQAHGCSAPAPPTIGDKRRDAANERKLKAQAILDKNFPNRNKK